MRRVLFVVAGALIGTGIWLLVWDSTPASLIAAGVALAILLSPPNEVVS